MRPCNKALIVSPRSPTQFNNSIDTIDQRIVVSQEIRLEGIIYRRQTPNWLSNALVSQSQLGSCNH